MASMEEGEGHVEEGMDNDNESYHSELEDDDYDLIEENLGVKVKRKRFKRVKRIVDDSSDEEERRGGNEREAIAQQLFDGSDNEDEGDARVPDAGPRDHYSSDSDEYSETDDFIVDEDGEPVGGRKRRRGAESNVAPSVLQAQDIFGVDFDYNEFQQFGSSEGSDHSGDEDQRFSRKKPHVVKKPFYEVFEPEELERGGYTAEAQTIRNTDIPERHQLRRVPITKASEQELKDEAEWICKKYKFIPTRMKAVAKPVAPVEPPPESDANWEQDWDAKTTAPGPKVPAPDPIPAPAASNSDWDDDWDKGSVAVETPAATMTNSGSSSRRDAIPNPPQSNADWAEEDWDTPVSRPIVPANSGSNEPNVKGNSTQPSNQGSGGWEDDWDTQTNVQEPAVFKLPAIPAPRQLSTPADAPEDDGWAEKDWDSRTAVNVPGAGDLPMPDTSVAESNLANTVFEEVDVSKCKPKVQATLDFIRNKQFEVPYIAFYKRDHVYPELSFLDLWNIFEMDTEYTSLRQRVETLVKVYTGMKEFLDASAAMVATEDEANLQGPTITDKHITRVREVKTFEELKDMQAYFRLHFTPQVIRQKEMLGQRVNHIRLGNYGKIMQNSFIPVLLGVVGITSEQFAENLKDKYQRHTVKQYDVAPDRVVAEIAKDESVRFTSFDVTNMLKTTYAMQLGHEPVVRQCVRNEMMERAAVNVWPTQKGHLQINESHPCCSQKFLKAKPLKAWKGDEFLRVVVAEKDGLLNVAYEKPAGYFEEIKELIGKDEYSRLVQDWNELREECLKKALEEYIYPEVWKEVREHLLKNAHNAVIESCADKLKQWLSVAPMTADYPNMQGSEWKTSDGIRVMAIAYDKQFDETGAVAAVVQPNGELYIHRDHNDHLKLGHILRYATPEKDDDMDALQDYIRDLTPHLIVISGESIEAVKLKVDVNKVVNALVSCAGFPQIPIEILDNQVSKTYSTSKKSIQDLGKECHPLLKQAISLARRAQDPLLEIAQLWNQDEDILCIKFHLMQDHVPKERLKQKLEIEFINRTCEVGVDINRALSYPHTDSVVQFISGLGRTKAAWLLRTLKHKCKGRLESRDVVLKLDILGGVVFENCIGFIKIDSTEFEESCESYVEIMDGTRIHPLCYETAREICSSALEGETYDGTPVDEIMNNPQMKSKLNELDFVKYANVIMEGRNEKVSSLLSLMSMKAELINRYQDCRRPYESPTDDILLNILTKETPETMHIGRLVTAKVARVIRQQSENDHTQEPSRNEITGKWTCPVCGITGFEDLNNVWNHFDAKLCAGKAIGVKVFLDNGMAGFIPMVKLSDKEVTNPDERVVPGQMINCRITKIYPEKLQVECTSRSSDLNNVTNEWIKKDEYYDLDREAEELEKLKALHSKKSQTRVKIGPQKRVVHPSFHDVSYAGAEKMLESMTQGEAIVRPSSKGYDHLTVTWKVTDGVAQHVDVLETPIKATASTAAGQSYTVDGDVYEDIDEILARYIGPKASNARDILTNRYYVFYIKDDLATAEAHLAKEKEKNPKKIHYIFHTSAKYPGKFFLSYLPRHSAIHEMITVIPDGFRFRQQIFDTLIALMEWFKGHYQQAPPNGTPIISTGKSGVSSGDLKQNSGTFRGYETAAAASSRNRANP